MAILYVTIPANNGTQPQMMKRVQQHIFEHRAYFSTAGFTYNGAPVPEPDGTYIVETLYTGHDETENNRHTLLIAGILKEHYGFHVADRNRTY